ncbi:hypothetical protein AUR64_19515 [Haloprofundus marisrubri]|uniref:DUF7344 domain-containing protein n=1 Tax=Haloprofundus marisrubri TaxID=1514971 RepID=A0A0W1R4W1_9EURY|nr:hypothetical protein [Haloprofundus marisrubri]KTG08419.1 hypothetical protein AUR64_19515 [Haloprofundus marisrubri]
MHDRPVDSSTSELGSRPVTSLSTGQLQTLFASTRRQQVVRALRTCSQPTPLDELVETVVAQNPEDIPNEAAVRRRLRVSLYHVDLPKLAEADIVRFDETERVVTELSDDIDGVRL